MSVSEDVAPVLAQPLAEHGMVLEDVSVVPAGRRRIVRVALDSDLSSLAPGDDTSSVPALTLDQVADAARIVSAALDASDVMGDAPYVLEVSSPGVDRPLTQARHFRRNVGRLLLITLADGSQLQARLQVAGADSMELDVAGAKGRPPRRRTLPYAEVTNARVQVEFSHHGDGEAG